MNHPQPSYYAIIPAHVRYCKEIEMGAKLLYGEITALASDEGYCWATNQYFADLYDIEIRTIQRWIKSLKDQKFIVVEVLKDGFQTSRKLWISQEIKTMFTRRQKCQGGVTIMSPRGDKNVRALNIHNTTSREREEGGKPPNPPPSLFSDRRVSMKKAKYDKLVAEHGQTLVNQMVDRLDEYADINPKRFRQYGCHGAVIAKWIREDKPRGTPNAQGSSFSPKNSIINSLGLRLKDRYRYEVKFGQLEIWGDMGILARFASGDEVGIERWLRDKGL